MKEIANRALAKVAMQLGYRPLEDTVSGFRGEVFMELRDGASGKLIDKRHQKNLIVKDFSVLLARLAKNNQEPPKGLFCLAVGTGDIGWNPMAPPAPTNTQRSLYAEISRKVFASTTFIDGAGIPVGIPTNVVDFTTTFTESEAVGPLVEMGLLGGNISTNLAIKNPTLPPNGPYNPLTDLTLTESLGNYLTFAVLNKPPTATLTITWRIQF